MRQPRALTIAVPSLLSVPSTSSTLRPGRTTSASTSIGPIGIGLRISNVARASRASGSPPTRSSSRPSSAHGGPACWWPASQGPRVSSVAA